MTNFMTPRRAVNNIVKKYYLMLLEIQKASHLEAFNSKWSKTCGLLYFQLLLHLCSFCISCSTTIYNKLFHFVNTVFLWNTVSDSVLTLSPLKFHPALHSLLCHQYITSISIMMEVTGKGRACIPEGLTKA